MLPVDQHSGDTRQFDGKSVQVTSRLTVEHVDAVGAGMSHVDPPTGLEHVGVVEADLRSGRDRDEACADEGHVTLCAVSFLHQA